MHVSFALFADAANLSQEGKLNILGVFDAVQVATMPTVHPAPPWCCASRDPGPTSGRIPSSLRWLNPAAPSSGRRSGSSTSAPPRHRSRCRRDGSAAIAAIDLPLDEVGGYTMQIALDDKLHASVELQVRMGAPVLPASGMVS
jgi:hypothetical protein